MASTNALLAGLQSFDSSDAGQQSRAAGMTVGGITFGSVAESFHSEDYSREQLEEEERRRARGKGREEQSLLEEVEEESVQRDAWGEDGSQIEEAKRAEEGQRRVAPSTLVEMGDSRSEVADSSNLLRELSMEESRELVRGGARAGEKKVESGAQSLTLREQEKVRSCGSEAEGRELIRSAGHRRPQQGELQPQAQDPLLRTASRAPRTGPDRPRPPRERPAQSRVPDPPHRAQAVQEALARWEPCDRGVDEGEGCGGARRG